MANPKIDGTHNPTNKAPSRSPLNHIISEKIKVPKARNNKILSVLLSLLIIFMLSFRLSRYTNLYSLKNQCQINALAFISIFQYLIKLSPPNYEIPFPPPTYAPFPII